MPLAERNFMCYITSSCISRKGLWIFRCSSRCRMFEYTFNQATFLMLIYLFKSHKTSIYIRHLMHTKQTNRTLLRWHFTWSLLIIIQFIDDFHRTTSFQMFDMKSTEKKPKKLLSQLILKCKCFASRHAIGEFGFLWH